MGDVFAFNIVVVGVAVAFAFFFAEDGERGMSAKVMFVLCSLLSFLFWVILLAVKFGLSP